MKNFFISLLVSLITSLTCLKVYHQMTLERPEKMENAVWLNFDWKDTFLVPTGTKIHSDTTIELKTVCIDGIEYYVYSKSLSPRYRKSENNIIQVTCSEEKP